MSGLFRRLVRQASGPRPTTVHAMARLPFHAPPEPLPSDEGGTPMPLAPAPESVPTPSATVARSPHALEPVRSSRHGLDEAVSPVAPAIDTPSADTPAPLVAQRPDGPSPRAADAHPRSDQPAPDVHSPRPATAPAATIVVDTAAPAAQAEARAASARAAPREPTTVATGPDALPEALLPPQAAAAPAAPAANPARSATPARPGRPAPVEASAPTEVHVHIGRIEVTAVHAPAPPKRPARSGQAPMSLDAYLAKRQRSPS